jgi:hypothetical protein
LKGEKTFNIRPFVKSVSVNEDKDILMTLEKIDERIVRPSEVIQCLLKLSEKQTKLLGFMKIETLFRASRASYQEMEMVSKSV